MKLGHTCAECGGSGAGKRQLCEGCEPLYPDIFRLHIAEIRVYGRTEEVSMKNDTAPKDAQFAREAVNLIARSTKSASSRLTMARAAVRIGNYTPEGKDVWRRYLEDGAPSV